MLTELKLSDNGEVVKYNRVDVAIERIRSHEPIALQKHEAGYFVCISGGKDSSVIQQLCIMAGVKCEFVHSHTSCDHPETVYFVRREQKRLRDMGYSFEVSFPRDKNGKHITMWNLIPKKGFPLRIMRYCCTILKENDGAGRVVVTGVRREESLGRANKGLLESWSKNKSERIILNNDNDDNRKLLDKCVLYDKLSLNPIVDWSESDVWEFIRLYQLPYNPLYDQGYRRVGCVGCCMARASGEGLDANPKYKSMYLRAGERYLKYRKERGLPTVGGWSTAEKYYAWWNGYAAITPDNQLSMELEEDEADEYDEEAP